MCTQGGRVIAMQYSLYHQIVVQSALRCGGGFGICEDSFRLYSIARDRKVWVYMSVYYNFYKKTNFVYVVYCTVKYL